MESDDLTVGDLIGYVLLVVCAATISPYAAKGMYILVRIAWSWYCFGR